MRHCTTPPLSLPQMTAVLSAFVLPVIVQHLARADTRQCGAYSVPADALVSGGRRATGGAFVVDHSLGDIGTVQTSGAFAGKSGYIGTLTDPAALTISATPTNVNEGSSRQLDATLVNDDATVTPLAPGAVAWTLVSGPIASLSASGLATAAPVFAHTPAVVRGLHLGRSNMVTLLVVNTGTDDFGSYAGDGLDDAWQAGFFGTNSALAGPGVDADGDGQTNAFEFVTGTAPNVTTSRFDVAVLEIGGSPGEKNVTFSHRYPDRMYFVDASSDLLGWNSLTSASTNDVGTTRTVRDLSAGEPQKFYRVRITKP